MSNWENVKKLNELYILKLNKDNNYQIALPKELQNLNLNDMIFSINHLNSISKFTGFNLIVNKDGNTLKSTLKTDSLKVYDTVAENVTTAGFDYTTLSSFTITIGYTQYISCRIIGGHFHNGNNSTNSISIKLYLNGNQYYKTITSDLAIGIAPASRIRHFLCEFDIDVTELPSSVKNIKFDFYCNRHDGERLGIAMSAGMGGGYEVNFHRIEYSIIDEDVDYELDCLCLKEVY